MISLCRLFGKDLLRHDEPALSAQQGVGEDVGVDLQGVAELTASAAAAVARVGAVVEPVGRVNEHKLTPQADALEVTAGRLFAGLKGLDGKDGGEDGVRHGDGLERFGAEEGGHLAAKGFVPVLVGAPRRGEQEAAVLDVALEVLALAGGEAEVALAGEHDEGEAEELVAVEAQRAEAARGVDAGALLHGAQKGVGEAARGLGAGVDKVAALHDALLGVSGGGQTEEGRQHAGDEGPCAKFHVVGFGDGRWARIFGKV